MDSRKRFKPNSNVTFYTESGELVARNTSSPEVKGDDAVVYIQTTRNIGSDSPTFVIELARTANWHKWITPNDLVKIEMHRPPEVNRTVMVGIVDDVRKSVSAKSGKVTRVITISGRSVAKAFIEFDVGVVPEADYVPGVVGWLLAAGVTVSQSTASNILEGIWTKIAKEFINYKFSNGYDLFDLIGYDFKDRPNMILLDESNVASWQGSLWGLMKDIAEDPFYELFWEIEESTNLPKLYLRPTPFNQREWNKLKTHTITDDLVQHEDIGRSDVETYTIYSVGAQTLFSVSDPYKTFGHRPIWYKPYANKYGIRRLHVETKYMSTATEPDATVTEIMASLMEDLYNWNIRNNQFFNGQFVVQGNGKYKIGERLMYPSQEDGSTHEFYIQGVSQEYRRFETWSTILEVTRGSNPADRFASPVGEWTEYSGLGLLDFNPEMAKQLIMQGDLDGAMTDFLEDTGVASGTALNVVEGAKEVLANGINGKKIRYVFGGVTSPNLDCSSFTQYIFKKYAGMSIGRTTGQQIYAGVGTVAKGNLLPGDLVLFKNTYNSSHPEGVSHVGIYIGGGKFIHNSSGGGGVGVGDLSDSYWVKHWLKGRRMFEPTNSGSGGGSGSKDRPSWATGNGAKYEATAYGAELSNLMAPPGWKPSYKTASGTTPKGGRTVAVDRKKHKLGSQLWIEVPDMPEYTGLYTAEDVGGAIKGNRVDIYIDDIAHLGYDTKAATAKMKKFGRRTVYVWVP